MGFQRNTIEFSLPWNMESIGKIGSYEEGVIAQQAGRSRIKMYLNPESFAINDQKLITETLTKGGYAVQYWGEQLTNISINGTTGSSGIQGINVLRRIYRHEQIAMRGILQERLKVMEEEARQAALDAAKELQPDYTVFEGGVLLGTADFFTGGAASALVGAGQTALDVINGRFSYPDTREYSNFTTTPTLASFATAIEMYFQGEVFRGYFTQFSSTENASSPGLFNYSFTFKVTLRTGKRNNFMPWHRNTVVGPGPTTRQASIPTYPNELAIDELSVKYRSGEGSGGFDDIDINPVNEVRSAASPDQAGSDIPPTRSTNRQ